MNELASHKPEILAPAGTAEAFVAAVEAGADAVYIGAPQCNARALARDFPLGEIDDLIDYAHRQGVKVYLAMNSLVKEAEIPAAVELLAAFEAFGADALIVQDLGLASLARRHFPTLRLHASTLAVAHNSLAVKQFAAMGFSRVVLARELTLEEIGAIRAVTDVELEVFVHGALCFSYSGLCLFSSYQGGKSGLRGRCVQPCRRRYTWTGKGKGAQSGYFFSMNDLAGLEYVPQLAALGVASLKIEGRMKNAHYVGQVVRAYRTMREGPADDPSTLAAARELLADTMGRSATAGYFAGPQPDDALSPQHSGNIGSFVGRLEGTGRGRRALVSLREPVRIGDRLRLHREASGERQAFTLKGLFLEGRAVEEAPAGSVAGIPLPAGGRPGDSLYKIDTAERRQAAATKAVAVAAGGAARSDDRAGRQRRAAAVLAELERRRQWLPPAKTEASVPPVAGKARGRALAWWLRLDDLALLRQPLPQKPDRLVLTLDRGTYGQIRRLGPALKPYQRSIVWALPPIIPEGQLGFYRKAIAQLRRGGYPAWQLGHLGQLQLFSDDRGSKGKKGRAAGRKKEQRLVLSGDYTLNALNSLTLGVLAEWGLGQAQIAIESDRDTLAALSGRKQPLGLGMTVYGTPPLFTARLAPSFFRYDQPFESPRHERFVLKKAWGQTVAVSARPFSLLDRLGELAGLGIQYGVVDLSLQRLRKEELAGLLRFLAGRGGKPPRGSSFNYLGQLR